MSTVGTPVVLDPNPFRPQDASGWKPGLAMAFFVHLFLLGGLALGVNWKIQPPAAVEAEIWTDLPKVDEPAPPQPVAPPPEVEAVKPPPPPPPQPEKAVEQPDQPADMAMVLTKPKVAKPKVEAPKEVKKEPPRKDVKKEPKEVFLPDPPKKPVKPVVDPKAEAKAKAAAEAQAKADAAKLAAQRQANLDRLMRNLAKDQISSAGLSESYKGRIAARVRPNISFPDVGEGNPAVLVRVECTPDGRITGRKILAGSGNERWDEAVLRALDRTQVLPADEHNRVPCPFDFNWRRNDF